MHPYSSVRKELTIWLRHSLAEERERRVAEERQQKQAELQSAHHGLASNRFSFDKVVGQAQNVGLGTYASERLGVLKNQCIQSVDYDQCKGWLLSNDNIQEGLRRDKLRVEYLTLLAQFAADTQLLRFYSVGYLWHGRAFDALKVIAFHEQREWQLPPRRIQLGHRPLDVETYLRRVGKWEEPDDSWTREVGAEIMTQLVLSHIRFDSSQTNHSQHLHRPGCCAPETPPFCLFLRTMSPIVKPPELGTIEINCKVNWDLVESAPTFVVLGKYPSGLTCDRKWDPLYGWPGHDPETWPVADEDDKAKLTHQRIYSESLARAIVYNQKQLSRGNKPTNQPGRTGGKVRSSKILKASDLPVSDYQKAWTDVRLAHIHYWAWGMAQTNDGRYKLCHRIIRDLWLSRSQKPPVLSQDPGFEWGHGREVDYVLNKLARGLMSSRDKAALDGIIRLLMEGGMQDTEYPGGLG